ncbi:MAG: hypothetical protein C4529_09990 [Deltaproteobacteria bacterium]|nr:MAG: hypothetical protein C4529_09990 [Deltaproteobacteria bacterium]
MVEHQPPQGPDLLFERLLLAGKSRVDNGLRLRLHLVGVAGEPAGSRRIGSGYEQEQENRRCE